MSDVKSIKLHDILYAMCAIWTCMECLLGKIWSNIFIDENLTIKTFDFDIKQYSIKYLNNYPYLHLIIVIKYKITPDIHKKGNSISSLHKFY